MPRKTPTKSEARGKVASPKDAKPEAAAIHPPVNPADLPRDIIFVHGVQWEWDYQLKGYSRPLQNLMRQQAPSFEFTFYEVLWSDVVEQDEQALIAGAGAIADVLKGNYAGAVFDLFKIIGQRSGFSFASQDEAFNTPLNSLISSKGGFMEKAASAILDIVFYFSDTYGPRIRQKVRDALAQARTNPPPIVFGHSLGSVILLDLIREDLPNLTVGGFVSAGSPIGLFEPNQDDPALAQLRWVNYYDLDDLVTFWNPLEQKGYATVKDRRIDTHELPFYSHVKYWTNSELARELADKGLTA